MKLPEEGGAKCLPQLFWTYLSEVIGVNLDSVMT